MVACLLAAATLPKLSLELVDTIRVRQFQESCCSRKLETFYAQTGTELFAYRRGAPPVRLSRVEDHEWLCGTDSEGLPIVKRTSPLRTIGQPDPAKTTLDPGHQIYCVVGGTVIGVSRGEFYATWEVPPTTKGAFGFGRKFRTQTVPIERPDGSIALSPSHATLAFGSVTFEGGLKRDWYSCRLTSDTVDLRKIELTRPDGKSSDEIGLDVVEMQLLSDTTAVALLTSDAFDDPKPKKELPPGFLGNDTFAPEDREFLVCRIDIASGRVQVADKILFSKVSFFGSPQLLYGFDSNGTFALLTSPTELGLYRFVN